MYTVKLKKYFSRFHLPGAHDISVRLDHMVHDPRFWPALFAVALVAALIAMVILLAVYGKTGQQEITPYYYYPGR